MNHDNLSGRVAVVTGASRGIGRAAALALAGAGAHVVAVARTVGGLEELDDAIRAGGGAATLVPLDLQDFAGNRPARRGALRALGPARHAPRQRRRCSAWSTPLAHLEPKVFERVMALNVTANWRLIRSLDPLLAPLRRRPGAVRHRRHGAWLPAVLGRLFDVEGGARGDGEDLGRRARRDRRSGSISSIPGRLRTHMRAQALPGEDPETLRPPDAVVPDILRMLSPGFRENGTLFEFRARQADAAA